MKSRLVRAVAALAFVLVVATGVEAQQQGLFGDRSVGSGLAKPRSSGPRNSRPGSFSGSRSGSSSGSGTVRESTSGNTVGSITGSERFIRGNRAAGDFVGSDSGDRRAFVGSQAGETSGVIQSAITGTLVRGSTIATVNRTRVRAPAPTMYEARLRIAFDFNRPSKVAAGRSATRQLKLSRAIDPTSSIEVSVAGSTATLRGVVGSQREKRLAEMLMLFEPGISSVKNELAIASSTVVPADRPSEVRGPEVLDP